MTIQIKKTFLLLGMLACLIGGLVISNEISQEETDRTISSPSAITLAVVHTGSQWIIQTTCKLLKPIQ